MERTDSTTRGANFERRRIIAAWVAKEVIPHEAAVRAWLSRSRVSPEDIDEVIQDSYYRISMLDSVDHIERPRSYFFSVARNLLSRRMKRAKIVPIEAIAGIEAFEDGANPSPEQAAGARLEYLHMLRFIAALPERCRKIIELRKIEGLSQRTIASHLNITEAVVEKQVYQGVRAILRAWREEEAATLEKMAAFEAEGRRR